MSDQSAEPENTGETNGQIQNGSGEDTPRRNGDGGLRSLRSSRPKSGIYVYFFFFAALVLFGVSLDYKTVEISVTPTDAIASSESGSTTYDGAGGTAAAQTPTKTTEVFSLGGTFSNYWPWFLGLCLTYLFIYAFTVPLGEEEDEEPHPPMLEKGTKEYEAAKAKAKADRKRRKEHRDDFIKFLLPLRAAYLFMIVAIGGSIIPFALLDRGDVETGAHGAHESPFQVLSGCAEDKPTDVSISCDSPSTIPQWLVVLGGGVTNTLQAEALDVGNSLSAAINDTISNIGNLDVALRNRVLGQTTAATLENLRINLRRLQEANQELASLIARAGSGQGDAKSLSEQITSFVALAQSNRETIAGQFAEAQESQAAEAERQQQSSDADSSGVTSTGTTGNVETSDNTGSAADQWPPQEVRALTRQMARESRSTQVTLQRTVNNLLPAAGLNRVTGGLVVPLFVVVLSLVGGAISMTRRLPEIQMLAAPSYREKVYEEKFEKWKKGLIERPREPIETVEARDLVIFQILQVITAPFLAMVVYASLEPDTAIGVVLIGFGAGFASEPLLMMLRKLIDRLANQETSVKKPEDLPQDQAGTKNS
ncbi:MAG: hypothetical protein AAGF94_13910 [Pseudomonadota bacterium]